MIVIRIDRKTKERTEIVRYPHTSDVNEDRLVHLLAKYILNRKAKEKTA